MANYGSFCINDVSLRDYQQEAKERIFGQWNRVDSILYQMPTGTGKTRLFTSIIRDINIWGLRHNVTFRVLIIAHRSELIEQCSQSLLKYHIDHGVLAGSMKKKRDLTKSIQVASIQTITHPANRCLLEDFHFDFIIIDEAHHAVANSYQQLWKYCPTAKILGVTATPWRMNNKGFADVFEAFIPSMQIKAFIGKGWLASYQYYSIPSSSMVLKTIDQIHEFDIEGDFKTSALIKAVDTSRIRAQLYSSYEKHAFGKKGIIYSISRIHSEHICEQYRAKGVRIENIDSDTPQIIRERTIKDFKDSKIDIIVNVDIFSEGFDCPDIEFIQLARPTKSLVKYIQQVGRGLRRNGDKQCIILDNVGMYTKFGLPDEERDWEGFFYGVESESLTRGHHHAIGEKMTRECIEPDMSEGNEEMVLVQGLQSVVTKCFDETINNEQIEANRPDDIPLFVDDKPKFTIQSKRIFAGKYYIEENDHDFYIVNTRNGNKMLLTKQDTFKGGVLAIRKDQDGSIAIVKAMSLSDVTSSTTRIIGYLKKTGLLVKFTSSDKSIKDKNVSV